MKYLLLLLPIVCFASSKPKFHFKDCVKITDGFYLGCRGTIEGFTEGTASVEDRYSIRIDDCKGGQAYAELDEEEIVLSKGCSK